MATNEAPSFQRYGLDLIYDRLQLPGRNPGPGCSGWNGAKELRHPQRTARILAQHPHI
jgi:hypothetical protein